MKFHTEMKTGHVAEVTGWRFRRRPVMVGVTKDTTAMERELADLRETVILMQQRTAQEQLPYRSADTWPRHSETAMPSYGMNSSSQSSAQSTDAHWRNSRWITIEQLTPGRGHERVSIFAEAIWDTGQANVNFHEAVKMDCSKLREGEPTAKRTPPKPPTTSYKNSQANGSSSPSRGVWNSARIWETWMA